MNPTSLLRTLSIAHKELLHILRDPQTLFFTLFVPICELFMLGYAIDTNVRNVRTVVVDHAGTQESRQLLQRFENSQNIRIRHRVFTEQEANELIVAGKARVGIIIPSNYSEKLQAGETAQILVLVDGTESSVAAEAVNVGNALALRESLARALGDKQLAVEARPRVLFNPDTKSANFFIPGLMVVMSQMMSTMLSANAIVREKQNGTLEQLFMTPVRRGELIMGKMAPYIVLTHLEFCFIALLMRIFFDVPIRGSFFTLLAIAFPFMITNLGLGLYISTKASTTDAAGQLGMATFLPSIFLSGYVFPLDSMPWILRQVAYFIPTTWLIDASRGVILRGAGWHELWPHSAALWTMALASILVSSLLLRKRL